MLIGLGTGVGVDVSVFVGSGVKVCVGVSVKGMDVLVGKGVASEAQAVNDSESVRNTSKCFLIFFLEL